MGQSERHVFQDGLARQDGQALLTAGKRHGRHKHVVITSSGGQGFRLVGELAGHLAHLLQTHHVGLELAQSSGHKFHTTLQGWLGSPQVQGQAAKSTHDGLLITPSLPGRYSRNPQFPIPSPRKAGEYVV